jgi:hypothetical protein
MITVLYPGATTRRDIEEIKESDKKIGSLWL